MFTCEQCQPLFLSYLYDALDREEGRRLKDHVESCSRCRLELEKAESQRLLLAEAVKSEFSEVRFVPPADTAKRLPEPTVRLARSPRSGKVWRRWAMAAAVLIAALGAGGYFAIAGLYGRQDQLALAKIQDAEAQEAAKRRATLFENQRRQSQENIRAIQDQINKLVGDWNSEENEVKKKGMLRTAPDGLRIQGPKSLQAGGRNEFNIQMPKKDPAAPPKVGKPANYLARVVDQKSKKVLVEQKIGDKGECNLDLPRDLPVKVGDQLALEIGGLGENDFKVIEHLPLVAPEYLTHLTTDRPMYRPGETVRFRSLTLERFSLKPPGEDLQVRFTITAPNGAEIYKAEGKALLAPGTNKPALKGPDGQPLRGIAADEFHLSKDVPGGQYILTVADFKDRFPPEKRTFLVNNWQTPRLNKELNFTRSSYGPKDNVAFEAKASRVVGGGLSRQLVDVRAQVDGKEVAFLQLTTDDQGRIKGNFDLPAAEGMPNGDGILSITYHDGAPETLVKPLPIVLNKLRVDFHPEGGDLVAGLKNRVYFQARTTLAKPADLAGRVVDQDGKEVAAIATLSVADQPQLNQGQGEFSFTPVAGKKYELKIDRPLGMEGSYPLPPTRTDGVVLNIPKGVADLKIDATVASAGKDRELLIGAYCRGRLLDHVNVIAKAGVQTPVTLRTTPGVSGVQRVTVFEKITAGEHSQFVPVAERLVYRPADTKLNLTLKADQATYAPGQSATISIQTADEKNQPKPGILLVYAADLSVLKLADDRTARQMPTHFLLTREVQKPEDLENADFLLGDHPQAKVAVDLLLGTQGWRRFAEQDPDNFRNRQPVEAPRVLFAMAQNITPDMDPQQAKLMQVDEKFAPQFVTMQKKLADQENLEFQENEQANQAAQLEQIQADLAVNNIHVAEWELQKFREHFALIGMILLVLMVLIGSIVCLILGVRRANHHQSSSGLVSIGACLMALVFVVGLGGLFFTFRTQMADNRMVAKGVAVREMDMNQRVKDGAVGIFPPMENKPIVDKMAMEIPFKNIQPPVNPLKGEKLGGAGPAGGADFAPKNVGIKKDGFVGAQPWPKLVIGQGMAKGIGPGQANLDLAAQDMEPWGGKFVKDGFRVPGAPLAPIDLERQLRQEGKFKEMLENRLRRAVHVPTGQEPFAVREYAHAHLHPLDGLRSDFTETLYWQPALVLMDGAGKVQFDLSDSITRFQVVALAHSTDGRLGAGALEIVSKLPFSLDPKMPIEVTSGDKIMLPVNLANDGSNKTVVQLRPGDFKGLDLVGGEPSLDIVLDQGKRSRRLFEIKAKPVGQPATGSVRFEGKTLEGFRDLVERKLTVVPEGFPTAKAFSGLLEKSASHEITLPARWEDMVPGSLTVKVSAYPSTLAELQKGLDSMLREPCGCFEQSSSSNYPNVMILNYLRDTRQNNPALEQRSRQLMESGYQKLTSFECREPADQSKKRGYEWFGQTAPPHEALTAYGLLQFRDMAAVFPVDDKMVQRTRDYLLSQRDGQGGFKRNPQALDSFGRAPDHITNAYIVWALTEAGDGAKLDKELAQLKTQAKDAKFRDPYFLSLVGLGLINAGQAKDGLEVLKELRTFQKDGGVVEGARVSITGSGERDLAIETTALALLGWLKVNRPDEFNQPVQKAAKWIGQQRGGFGGFGSTQGTILALKGLIAFTKDNQKTAAAGEMKLFVDDREVAVKDFPAGVSEAIELTTTDLKPGKNKLRLEVTGNTSFPYTLAYNYNALKPANSDNCPVHLATKLSAKEVKEGDTVRLTAVVENKSGKGQGMAVAIIGLPGGLKIPEDMAQLKRLAQLQDNGAKPGKISFFEKNGRELILYWRDLAPAAKIEVNLDLVCEIPGEYRGPASRAYLYYNGDQRFWTDPLAINITPRD